MSRINTVAGRPAIADLIDNSWDQFVNAVESLPNIALTDGVQEAISFGRTHLRVMVDKLCLAWGRTKEVEQNVQRIHMELREGGIRPMLRTGPKGSIEENIGRQSRTQFIEAVERVMLAASMKAVFERGREETEETGYIPDTGE